jgi:S1-C subfamily serine protease
VRSDVAPPVLGIEWSPPSPALCDQLDIPAGMVVQSVVAGTPAEKLGLERHDVLVELNGKTVAASADIRAALDPVKSGGKLAAVVVRKGRRQTLAAVR